MFVHSSDEEGDIESVIPHIHYVSQFQSPNYLQTNQERAVDYPDRTQHPAPYCQKDLIETAY